MADRAEAIKKAIAMARPGDVVLITGKGSEPVMAVAHGKLVPWDDRVEAQGKPFMLYGHHQTHPIKTKGKSDADRPQLVDSSLVKNRQWLLFGWSCRFCSSPCFKCVCSGDPVSYLASLRLALRLSDFSGLA